MMKNSILVSFLILMCMSSCSLFSGASDSTTTTTTTSIAAPTLFTFSVNGTSATVNSSTAEGTIDVHLPAGTTANDLIAIPVAFSIGVGNRLLQQTVPLSSGDSLNLSQPIRLTVEASNGEQKLFRLFTTTFRYSSSYVYTRSDIPGSTEYFYSLWLSPSSYRILTSQTPASFVFPTNESWGTVTGLSNLDGSVNEVAFRESFYVTFPSDVPDRWRLAEGTTGVFLEPFLATSPAGIVGTWKQIRYSEIGFYPYKETIWILGSDNSIQESAKSADSIANLAAATADLDSGTYSYDSSTKTLSITWSPSNTETYSPWTVDGSMMGSILLTAE